MGHVFAAPIHSFTEPPVKVARLAPLALAYPMSVQADFDVDFPEDVVLHASRPIAIADDNIEFAVKDSYGNKRLHIEYAVNTRRAAVPAKEVKSFADTLRQIRERVAYYFPVSNPSSSIGLRDARADVRKPSSEDDSASVTQALDREQETKVRTLSEDIGSGRLLGKELAGALVDRAVAYSNLDRIDEALADLGRALEVDPDHARAYIVRGEIYSKQGEQKRALAEFARALQRDAKSDPFMGRGRAYFYQGDYRAAQADFKRVAEQESKEEQLHALIWLYFATRRLGEDASAAIASVRSRADLSQWPGPMVTMLLGQITPEEALSGAWSFDRKTELLQRCEAYFFLGEYRLLAADQEAARAAFNESFATGVKYYLEYAYSRLELARLQADTAAKRAKK